MKITDEKVAELILYGIKHGRISLRKKLEERCEIEGWNDEDIQYLTSKFDEVMESSVTGILCGLLIQGQQQLQLIIEEKDKKISELRQQLIERRFDSIK